MALINVDRQALVATGAALVALPLAAFLVLTAAASQGAGRFAFFAAAVLSPFLAALLVAAPWRRYRPEGAPGGQTFCGRSWLGAGGYALLGGLGTWLIWEIMMDTGSGFLQSQTLGIEFLLLPTFAEAGIALRLRLTEVSVTGGEISHAKGGRLKAAIPWEEVGIIELDEWKSGGLGGGARDRNVRVYTRDWEQGEPAPLVFPYQAKIDVGEQADLFGPAFRRLVHHLREEASRRPTVVLRDRMRSLR